MVAVTLSRASFRLLGEFVQRRRQWGFSVLLYGGGDGGGLVVRELLARDGDAKILGVIDDDPSTAGIRVMGYPVLGGTSALTVLVKAAAVDRIVICARHLSAERLNNLEVLCSANGVSLLRLKIGLESLVDAESPARATSRTQAMSWESRSGRRKSRNATRKNPIKNKMCGICGELSLEAGRPVSAVALGAMSDQLVHRGPDSSGVLVSPDGIAGLGFRRLRIIDLTPNADQPMPNEDASIHVVFNGEIYNFRAIRERLLAAGHHFRSQSDTEVIVHAYEEKGDAFVDDLEGMFALAVWDGRRRRLVLARDRAGKKPLFVYRDDKRLAFASEIKSFFARRTSPSTSTTDHSVLLHLRLRAGIATFYRRFQVEPGTVVIACRTAVERRQYWRLELPWAGQPSRGDRPSRRHRRIKSLVTAAVDAVSSVMSRSGRFLSGGLDSTIVVGVMARLMREPVRTFSIGFEGDAAYGETAYARKCRQFGTNRTEFRVKPSAIGLLDRLLWHHDGPFGDRRRSGLLVSQLTRQHVTVVRPATAATSCLPATCAITRRCWPIVCPAPREACWRRRCRRFPQHRTSGTGWRARAASSVT